MPEIGSASKADLKQALDLELVLKPQDGQADTVLNLNLAPSFVTYHKKTVERVSQFFKTETVSPPALLNFASCKPCLLSFPNFRNLASNISLTSTPHLDGRVCVNV